MPAAAPAEPPAHKKPLWLMRAVTYQSYRHALVILVL